MTKYHATNDHGIVMCGRHRALAMNWREFLKRLLSEQCQTCRKCVNEGTFRTPKEMARARKVEAWRPHNPSDKSDSLGEVFTGDEFDQSIRQ
jgi:hypothetical protein